MRARTGQGDSHRPCSTGAALIVGAAVIVGAILLVRGATGPPTLAERLGQLMLEEGHHSCLNGQASRERFTAAERPDLYPDLLPRARSVARS
jgi:hypothetical protein